jgi:hypothetical protein
MVKNKKWCTASQFHTLIKKIYIEHGHGHTHHDPESDNEKSNMGHHDHGHLNMKGVSLYDVKKKLINN